MQTNKTNINNVQKCNQTEEKPIINLPDILRENLDIIVVGITPSGVVGVSNHHFSGPGNHFWTCITEVGLVSHPVTCEDDAKMLDYGIGFISFCTRPNKGTSDLSRKEMKAGAMVMVEKIKIYKPKIVVFNGIGIYEAFVGNKNFSIGLQPNKIDGTDSVIFVMPSSSARCAQLPRAEDKIPFFVSLKKLRDHMRGDLLQLEEKDVVFENYTEFRVTQPDPRSLLKAERRRKRKAELSAESGLQENLSEGTSSSVVQESIKSKTVPEIETSKDDRTFEASQNTFSSSIPTHSSILTPPLLSWPQNGGLTIIHTGQPIIMPTAGTQAASSNTLLLLDSNGLSFSTIPVPINQSHLQVRPVILPTEGDLRVSTTVPGQSLISPLKPNDSNPNNSHFVATLPQTIKARPPSLLSISDAGKVIMPIIKSGSKVLSLNENTKTTSASCSTESAKSIPDNNNCQAAVTVKNSKTGDIEIPSDSLNGLIQSSQESVSEIDVKYSGPMKDPIDQWQLFMNGIYTGEFSFPAPPQTIPVDLVDAMEVYQELSSSNSSRTLTVL